MSAAVQQRAQPRAHGHAETSCTSSELALDDACCQMDPEHTKHTCRSLTSMGMQCKDGRRSIPLRSAMMLRLLHATLC
jgi:hypothetical protein